MKNMRATQGELSSVLRCQKCECLIDRPYGLGCGHVYCEDCVLNDTKEYELDGAQMRMVYCPRCKEDVPSQQIHLLSELVATLIDIH